MKNISVAGLAAENVSGAVILENPAGICYIKSRPSPW